MDGLQRNLCRARDPPTLPYDPTPQPRVPHHARRAASHTLARSALAVGTPSTPSHNCTGARGRTRTLAQLSRLARTHVHTTKPKRRDAGIPSLPRSGMSRAVKMRMYNPSLVANGASAAAPAMRLSLSKARRPSCVPSRTRLGPHRIHFRCPPPRHRRLAAPRAARFLLPSSRPCRIPFCTAAIAGLSDRPRAAPCPRAACPTSCPRWPRCLPRAQDQKRWKGEKWASDACRVGG